MYMYKATFKEIMIKSLCPVSTIANVENNEIRIENNDVSSHIFLVLYFIRLTLVSHYSAFSSVRGADANVLNASARERRGMQNNVTRG